MSFREPDGAVMTANMKRLGWEGSIGASSLRGLQGRSATNQNGQAAEEKKERTSCGLDAARTFLASGSGRSVFRLTSPYIGLPGTAAPGRGERRAKRTITQKSHIPDPLFLFNVPTRR